MYRNIIIIKTEKSTQDTEEKKLIALQPEEMI